MEQTQEKKTEVKQKPLRPWYADACANLHSALCVPVLRALDYPSRYLTQKFVNAFETKKK